MRPFFPSWNKRLRRLRKRNRALQRYLALRLPSALLSHVKTPGVLVGGLDICGRGIGTHSGYITLALVQYITDARSETRLRREESG